VINNKLGATNYYVDADSRTLMKLHPLVSPVRLCVTDNTERFTGFIEDEIKGGEPLMTLVMKREVRGLLEIIIP
jgi:hypothetical protein